MKRYIQLWLQFAKMSAMADFEYRANIILRILGEFLWYTMQLSVFEVLYTHTKTISGWDVNDMRVFMGSLFVGDVIYMILLHENMDYLGGIVRKGDLDLYLTKPVNSQFMISFRKVSVSYLLNLILCGTYLGWAISNLTHPVSVWQIMSFVVMIGFGVCIMYAMRFMFATLTIVVQDAGNIQFIWHQMYRLATRPDPIYPMFMRYFILIFFPVAFFASVPSRILVEGLHWYYLVASPLLAAVLIWLSHLWWEKALRGYSSASS